MEEILKENVRKFMSSANLVYQVGDFTSATILYFKALFSVLDLIIFNKIKRIPKDHTERFRILEENFPIFYNLIDKLYPDYRSTYTHNLNKSDCDRVKNNVERIIKEQNIL